MSPRMTAEDRKAQVIRAAVAEFSVRGLEGTSTSDIAKRVGVSQPYLFRLFPTKKDLFIAAAHAGGKRIVETFDAAAEGKYGDEALDAMGVAYQELLDDDIDLLGMQLQQFAACHDPEVQVAVRGVMQDIWAAVENLTGATVEARVAFFAQGMLCNAIAAIGRADGTDPMWQPILDVLRDSRTAAENSDTADSAADTAADTEASAETDTEADREAGADVTDASVTEKKAALATVRPAYGAYAASAFGEKTTENTTS